MRLWHQHLIPLLPRQQLLGQHREACALRGKGWGKPHATVNYVFKHPYSYLYDYHVLIMNEMQRRGYEANSVWKNISYRGKLLGEDNTSFTAKVPTNKEIVYPEHNEEYLQECSDNLKGKGINITAVTDYILTA
jgi:uncharacterized protein (TIGR02328 family)